MDAGKTHMGCTANRASRKERPIAAAALVSHGASLGLVSMACVAAIVLIHTFNGEGAWMFVNLETIWKGFVPDPSYLVAETRTEICDAVAFSSLAGSVFLPFVDLIVCALYSKAAYDSKQHVLSAARGTSGLRAAGSSLIVVSIPIQVLFIVSSVAQSLLLIRGYGLPSEDIAEIMRTLLPNLVLVAAVNQSFLACCLAANQIIRNHIIAIGIISAAFIATCVLQMAYPETIIPVHAGYWFTLCSTQCTIDLASSSLLYSASSTIIALGVLTAAQNAGIRMR